MTRKISERPLNADLPESLWDDVERAAATLPLFKKKHLVGAALAYFVELSPSEQQRLVFAFASRLCVDMSSDEGADAVVESLEEAETRARPRRRRGAGKSSG